MNDQKKGKKFPIVQSILLLMMLVVLPAGSWYYLQQGYNYRKASLEKLQDFGTLPAFSFQNFDSTTVNSKDLKGSVIITGAFDYDDDLAPELKATIGKLFSQFNRREEFNMIIHLNNVPDSTVMEIGKEWIENYEFEFPNRFYLTSGNSKFAQNTLYSKASEEQAAIKNKVMLVDAEQKIRNYYSLDDEEDIKLLVHHVTIVLPRKQEKDIFIKRDTEK